MMKIGGTTLADRPMKFTLLDPLRGIAALWVFSFHYSFGPWLARDLPLVAALFRLGYLGVPLFFVISGYCITGSARSSLARGEPPWQFAYRRLRRVYPTLWFSLIFAVGMPFWLELVSSLKSGHYVPPPETLNNGFMHYSLLDWLSMVTLTRVFAHVPDATSLQYKFTSLNAVYWTLAIEVQFYAVVALAMYLRNAFYAGLALLTVGGVAASLVPATYITGIFLPYWPMFAVGVLLYWLLERGIRLTLSPGRYSRPAVTTAAIALALIFAGYLALGGPVASPIVALAFGTWLLIVFSVDPMVTGWRNGKRHRLSRLPLMLFFGLGNMSYSLYLMHTRLFPPAYQVVSQVLPKSVLGDIVVIGLTCAASYVFYWFAERPFVGSSKPRSVVATPVAEAPPAAA